MDEEELKTTMEADGDNRVLRLAGEESGSCDIFRGKPKKAGRGKRVPQ